MRIEKVRKHLSNNNLDAMLFTDLKNVRYLCGYSGSNGILYVDSKNAIFVTDFRYKTQVQEEVFGAEIYVPESGRLYAEVSSKQPIKRITRIGFEKNIDWETLNRIKSIFPQNLEWIPSGDFMLELRAVKYPDEIEKIERVVDIAQKALLETIPYIKPGAIERDIAAELEYRMKKKGAERNSFDTIVVSGYRSALVHGIAGDKKIEKGDFVTIDYGAYAEGYSSDLTRTFIIGEPSQKQKEVYQTVFESQAKAIEQARPGMKGKELDAVARRYINDAGYGQYFGHGLGHGLGLLVHDTPRVGSRSENILPKNAVITIEPGIYIPDFGGVRIEDDVLLIEGGCKLLSNLPKKLEEIILPV